jgi:hypothetical protein
MNITIQKIIDIMSEYDVNIDNENYDKEFETIIITCNINKINNSWKKSSLYISSNILEIANKEKYFQSKDDLINLKVKKPPFIQLIDNNEIEFIDGRNRFANLRDVKCLYMPFIIYTYEKEIISKIYS